MNRIRNIAFQVKENLMYIVTNISSKEKNIGSYHKTLFHGVQKIDKYCSNMHRMNNKNIECINGLQNILQNYMKSYYKLEHSFAKQIKKINKVKKVNLQMQELLYSNSSKIRYTDVIHLLKENIKIINSMNQKAKRSSVSKSNIEKMYNQFIQYNKKYFDGEYLEKQEKVARKCGSA